VASIVYRIFAADASRELRSPAPPRRQGRTNEAQCRQDLDDPYGSLPGPGELVALMFAGQEDQAPDAAGLERAITVTRAEIIAG